MGRSDDNVILFDCHGTKQHRNSGHGRAFDD